jgi:hypothetical protein
VTTARERPLASSTTGAARAKTNLRTPPLHARAAGALLLAACFGLAAIACAGGGGARTASEKRATTDKPSTASGGGAQPGQTKPAAMPGKIVGSALAIDLRPLGLVPTDGYTLPLLSPDGRLLAVQTGTVPDLATLLARPRQSPPVASRIAMYRVEPRGLVRLGETGTGLVLGRSADARGFLVESPRPDGSRWIGRFPWGGDEAEWLVQDGRVNAFGALGPDGALAYATRERSDRAFDLVVRRAGRTARLPADGVRSHLFPVFSADGARLLAFSLRDGILELVAVDPSSDESMRQSATRSLISDRANDEMAMQMVAPQGTRDGADGDDWILFHPTLGSLVRWNPVDGVRAFAGRPLAAGRIDAQRTAFLVGDRVRIRTQGEGAGAPAAVMKPDAGVSDPGLGTVLLDGVAVPRAIAPIDGAPAILLAAPDRNGLRLLLARLPG